MITNRDKLRLEIENLDIDTIHKLEDRYASFPFITTLTWRNGVVYAHDSITAEAKEELDDAITEPEVESVFTAISVAAAVIRKKVQNAGIDAISDLYRPLSSEDTLSLAVFEDIDSKDIDRKKGEFLLSAIRGGDLRIDVAGVNGTRLAANLGIIDDEFRKELEDRAKTAVVESIEPSKIKYEETLNMFGRNSPIQASQMVANSLSTAFVALAFPMPDDEADRYFDMLDI